MVEERKDVHLVVLQHGLWGNAQNLEFLQTRLNLHAEGAELPVRTLNSKVSENRKTYDGVDLMGERLVTLIKEHVAELASEDPSCRVTHISFIGYSMGGLVTRYAVGKLEHEGAFAPKGDFTPMNFITIATPHLGAWRASTAWRNRTFNKLVPPISSWSGYHMMFEDQHALGRPLLINMADPALPFFQGLLRFRKLALLGNIHFDSMVPYRTATISPKDPYEATKSFFGISKSLPADDPIMFPSIRRPVEPGAEQTAASEDEKQPPIGGAWVPFTALALLPVLFVPLLVVLGVMVVQGKRHYKSLLSRPDHAWVTEAMGTEGSDVPGKSVNEEEGSPRLHLTKDDVRIAIKVLPRGGDIGGSPRALASEDVPLSLTPLEHQEWVAEHLNKLPWVKVGVDIRHGHSHAGIVVRTPNRFERRDHLQYLLEKCMEW